MIDDTIARCLASETSGETWLPFVGLDRQQGHSHVGIEGSFVMLDDAAVFGRPDQVERLDIHGEYTNACGNGAYVTIPLGYQSDYGDYGWFVPGDLEAGAVVSIHVSDELRLVTHGGLTLPTQKVGDNGTDGAIGAGSGLARLSDYALVLPINFAARIGVSPIVSSGTMRFRADLGADISLGDGLAIEHNESAFHIGAGLGTFVGNLGLAGEAVAVFTPWFSSMPMRAAVAVSARYRVRSWLPYLSVQLPMLTPHANPESFYTEHSSLAVTAGIEYQPD